jgi:flagellar basal body P-ring formation protein FlgA
MARAAAVFLCLVALLAAGAVLADTVQVVRAIRGQSVLAAEDLAVVEGEVPGAITTIDEAVGKEAKVTLYPGRPILLAHLGAPALVERNAVVRMNYASGPLRIVTDGRALDRGGVGEPVRVMNLASRQTVTGIVAPDGSVEVGE